MKKISLKKWKWIIGSTISAFSIIPLIAVSAVACSQPTLSQKVSNQEIANALQNYFAKNPNLLNQSTMVAQKSNLFLTPINYINWSEILGYVRAQLNQKPDLNSNISNYDLNAIGIHALDKSNYNEANASISFKLTYNGVQAQNFSIINGLFTRSNFLLPLNNLFNKENIAASLNKIFLNNGNDSTVFQYDNQSIYFMVGAAYNDGTNPSFHSYSRYPNPSSKFINSSFNQQTNEITLNFISARNIWIPRSNGTNNSQANASAWYSLYLPNQTNFSVIFNMNNIEVQLTKNSMNFKPKNKQAFILNLPSVYYGSTVYNAAPGSFGKNALPGFPADANNMTKLNLSLNFWSALDIDFSL